MITCQAMEQVLSNHLNIHPTKLYASKISILLPFYNITTLIFAFFQVMIWFGQDLRSLTLSERQWIQFQCLDKPIPEVV